MSSADNKSRLVKTSSTENLFTVPVSYQTAEDAHRLAAARLAPPPPPPLTQSSNSVAIGGASHRPSSSNPAPGSPPPPPPPFQSGGSRPVIFAHEARRRGGRTKINFRGSPSSSSLASPSRLVPKAAPRSQRPPAVVERRQSSTASTPPPPSNETTPAPNIDSSLNRRPPPNSGNNQQITPPVLVSDAAAPPPQRSECSCPVPEIIRVNPGEDIVTRIMALTKKNEVTIVGVHSAVGTLSVATIRQPAVLGGSATYQGQLDIVALSGSFAKSQAEGQVTWSGALGLVLAKPDGVPVCGVVSGLLIASSAVQVEVTTFATNNRRESTAVNPGGALSSST